MSEASGVETVVPTGRSCAFSVDAGANAGTGTILGMRTHVVSISTRWLFFADGWVGTGEAGNGRTRLNIGPFVGGTPDAG